MLKSKFCVKTLIGILLPCFFLFFIHELNAATISAAAGGNWNNAATWTGGVIPGASDDVIIQGNYTVTVTANASCNSILVVGRDVQSGTGTSLLQINAGNTLVIVGDLNIKAGIGGDTPPYFSGKVINNGTLTVGANLVLDASAFEQYGFAYFDQGVGVTNIAGNLSAVGYSTSQSANITFTGGGTINLTGQASTLTINANAFLDYAGFAGIINVTGASSSVNVPSGSFTMGSGNSALNISGSLTTGGTFTTGKGTVNYQGAGAQTIIALAYFNLTSSNTGARTISGAVGIAGAFTKGTNAYTVTGSTIDFNGTGVQFVPVFDYNNLTISGAHTGNKVTLDNSDTINIAGALSNTSTYTGTGALVNTGSVINYMGAAAQTVSVFPYNDLVIIKPQGVIASTANNNVAVGGNCTVISGVLSIGTGATTPTQTAEFKFSGNAASSILEVKDGAKFRLMGTSLFPASFPKTLWKTILLNPNSTVEYAATGAQTIVDHQYGNLLSSGTAGTRTLSPTGNIKVAGTFTPNASNTVSYTITGSTVEYNGASVQTITPFNYNNLTVTNNPANITLSATGTVGIAGAFTPNAVSFGTIAGSTVDYNATTAQGVSAFNYFNLTLSGNKTSNSITLSPTGLIQVAGALANSINFTTGTIVNTNSTISYNGTAAQSVIDFPYNNLMIDKASGIASLTVDLTATNLTGNLSILKGTLATASFVITGSSTKSLTIANPGILDVSGTTATFPTGFTTVGLSPLSLVNYSSTGAQTIAAQNYGNLTSSSTGARTLAATGVVGVATNFVSGTNTYTNTGSTVEFNGTGAQSLTGSLGNATNTFNNLTINNSGTATADGLTLASTINVAGVLNMKEGQLILNGKTLVITTQAGTAVVRTNGVIVSESSDNTGKVRWIIGTTTGDHTIPFGKSIGQYIPFKFNLTSGDAGDLIVSTYATATNNQPLPTTPVAVNSIDQQGATDAGNAVVDRFWQVDATGAAAKTATLTFEYLTTEKPGNLTTPRVQRWSGSAWEMATTGQTSTTNSVTAPGLTAFGSFAVYDNSPPIAAFTSDVVTNCVGGSIQFFDNSLPGATSWNWTFPGGTPATSTLQNPIVTYSTSGLYDVTLVAINHYGSNTSTKTNYINIGAPAAPSASNSGPVCKGSALTLMASSLAGATFAWTGPNGFTSTSQNPTIPSVTLASAGTYSVTTKLNGCTSVAGTTTVVVNPNVTPTVAIASNSGSNSICAGESMTFTATPTNGGATPIYQWRVNGNNVGTNSPTYTTNILNNGNTVSCRMTSSADCAAPLVVNSATITVTVGQSVTPTVDISISSGSNTTCEGAPVTFTATATNGGSTPTYQWRVNGSNVGTNSPEFSSSTLADGSIVNCELVSNENCVSPTTATSTDIVMSVAASVTPAVSIAVSSGTDPICVGESVVFTATPTNGGTAPTYQWSVNGSSVANGDIFSTTTLTDGSIVNCKLLSNAQCATPAEVSSTDIIMTVRAIEAPTVSIAVTEGTNPTCSGESVTLTATPTYGGTAPIYEWSVNNVISGITGETFTSSTFVDMDLVKCVLTSNDNCVSTTTATSPETNISVIPLPAKPTISQIGLELTSSEPTGNQWYLNGGIIPLATNSVYTVTENGIYTVVVSLNGCQSPQSDAVQIDNVGLGEIDGAGIIAIGPNPSNGLISIKQLTPYPADFMVSIYNAVGDLIYHAKLTNSELDISKEAGGLYTLKIDGAAFSYTTKLIKQ